MSILTYVSIQITLVLNTKGGNLKFSHVAPEIFFKRRYKKCIKQPKEGGCHSNSKKLYFTNLCDEFQLLKYEYEYDWLIPC